MRLITILFIVLHACVACEKPLPEEANYFTNNAFGNPIVGKMGEYYKGVTYVTYQGEQEDPYVVAYNHKKKTWDGPYKAGVSLLGKKPGKIDNHGKPSLVIDSKGYIHIVFGGHGGSRQFGENTLGNYNGGKQIHVISKKPMDITSWEVMDNVSPFGTYSQFLKMDNGDIYLFYRHGAHRSDWVYQISKDDGLTFSPKVSIVKAKPAPATEDCADVYDSWYLDFQRGKANDIIVSFTYHICKNMRPHYSERQNCYYMKLDTESDQWFNVKKEVLSLPVTKAYADKMTLVKNTGDNWVHIGHACVDDHGHPHVSSYEGLPDGSNHGGNKYVNNYQWTGEEWIGGETNLPLGRGELAISSNNDSRFLLGYQNDGNAEIAWWNPKNQKNQFNKAVVYFNSKGGQFTLSDFIRNAHPDAQLIASQKIAGTNYSKVFLVGDKGAVKRKKSEADVLQTVPLK